MEFFQANIHLREVLVQLLAFVIVFFALTKLGWKPLLKSLEARRERFQREWDHIEKTKKEVETLGQEYARRIQKIEEEARQKFQEAVEESRQISKQIQEKARLEAQHSFQKAKTSIDLEIAKTRLTLRREIADLAIQVAEKVLQEKMDDAKQHQKALELIENLEKDL